MPDQAERHNWIGDTRLDPQEHRDADSKDGKGADDDGVGPCGDY